MSATFSMRIHLRGLVLALTVFSAIAATANALYASYCVQRDQLIANTLESNRVYAAKLAESAANFLKGAQQQLRYSAQHVADALDSPAALEAEASRVQEQSDSFNSVGIVGADGVILAASRNFRGFLGARVDSPGSRAALQARQALISPPYVDRRQSADHAVAPDLLRDGRYRGYIAGSIHLRNEAPCRNCWAATITRMAPYLYVVDRDGKLIYHVDPSRLGEDVSHNPVVAAVKQGESGARRLLNTKDVDMLAGYAVVTSSGWGIIAQRPTAVTLEPIQELIWAPLGYAAPLAIAFLLAIWWCARMISLPLAQLATNVEHHDVAVAMQRVRSVKAWYFEAERLKHAVIWSFTSLQEKIGKLNLASITDPSPACATGAACRTPSSKCAPRPSAMA